MSDSVSVYSSYTPEYIKKCMTFWYANGRVKGDTKIQKLFEENKLVDEHGRVPSTAMIGRWREEYMWDAWADEMDAKVMTLVENDLVLQKSKMLKEQAVAGYELWKEGLKYIKSEGFDSSSAAVQAVVRGTELERTARGIGETLEKLSKMSDADLTDAIMKELQRASASGQVVDAEEIKEKENDTDNVVPR